MDEIIKNLPNYGLIIVGVLGLIFILVKKNFFISGKNFIIKGQTITPESIILAFEKVLDTQFNILKIEFKTRLKEQMSFAEDKVKEIRENTIKIHRDLLVKNGVPAVEVHQSPQLKAFEKLIYKLLDKMLDIVRSRFNEIREIFSLVENENDDYNYIRDKFENYKSGIITIMINDARDFVTDEWIENEWVSRRENWESMSSALECIGQVISDILINGIKIQLKYSKIIKELKSNQNNYIKNVTHFIKDKK